MSISFNITPATDYFALNSAMAPEVQQYLQSHADPPYEQLPLEERLEYTLQQEWINIENIRIAMCGNELDPVNSGAFSLCNSNKKTLFHSIARGSLEAYHCPNNQFVKSECQRLFKEAVQAQTNLCTVTLETGYEYARHTPLMTFFHANGMGYYNARRILLPYASVKGWTSSKLYELGDLLRYFIAHLHRAGLSKGQIIAYGEREQLVHQSGILNRDITINKNTLYYDSVREIRIIDFSYGPTLRHWNAWTSNLLDEWVGEFWAMIDKPELHIPGAWIDEDM